MRPHITSSSNFNPLQSAYRKHHSTETALLNTLDHIYTSADKSQPTALVALDLSAAFDTIDHSTLLFRLHSDFGVSGAALSWIYTYLTDRKQRVTVGHCNSPVTTVSSGVPQGSVLGPFSLLPTSPLLVILLTHLEYHINSMLMILSCSSPSLPPPESLQ